MMTKQDRERETRKGKIILRAQYDSRSGTWKIVKYSSVGGWSRFGSSWYLGCEGALASISRICANNPEMYINEDEYKATKA